MRKLPDLDQITAFAAVAEELSFKRAAQRLAIDASALSRRIKELETRLVFSLLFRTTQLVELTAAGKRFTTIISNWSARCERRLRRLRASQRAASAICALAT